MPRFHKLIWSILIALFLVGIGVALVAELRRTSLPVLGRLHPFTLTNQLGLAVSPSALQGKVVVVNVIFSRCPTQCHQLSQKMAALQKVLGAGVLLVSLTADPQYDPPAVLTQYGRRYGTDPQRWWFLTGPKSEVYRVAEKDLLFTVMDTGEANPKLEDRFIHAGNFVILDRQGRLRASVAGEEPDAEQRILELVRQLSRETSL